MRRQRSLRLLVNGAKADTDGRAAPAWPKRLPDLTPEQERIREDFYQVWMHRIPRRYKLVNWFDHAYPARRRRPGERTLEIGAGLGSQIAHEGLEDQAYVATDVRESMLEQLSERFPRAEAVVADAQADLPFEDDSFDRVVAVHVLEHLPNLPAALDQIRRVMKPTGRFVVVIPCEGGRVHRIVRALTARPLFERTYGTSYDWFVATEHPNVPWEIEHELRARFDVDGRTFFPFVVPSVNLNFAYGLTCLAKDRPG